MKQTSITDAKNGLSRLIDSVKAGNSILIVDRGDPVARLQPIEPSDLTADQRIEALVRAGLANAPRKTLDAKAFAARKMARLSGKASAVEMLIADREESR
ncbi:MAG: type II toxin-antitoxin system prevent-host-death family antitoxin [Verrucomicrobia bacterium]|nr:type II toxin-antitoxin system prevent-host-death family antitoxin [Verrucomicrobiota bacterium]MDA1087681.1 type II toxin-antitoxin system prevent-host-death family antitoxin [Verrucomicrobiota bacterium]